MPDATAKNTAESGKRGEKMSQTAESPEISGNNPQSRPALDACYGQIGISAVAAAAKYQGHSKNPAYAPAPNDWRAQFAQEVG
jgi:hypothetical protein